MSGLWQIAKFFKNYFDKKKKQNQEIVDSMTAIRRIVEDLESKSRRTEQMEKINSEANIAILHNKIYKTARGYIERGWVTVEELNDLECLHTSYKEYGGNGTGDRLYNSVLELKIKELH
ncbi:hypothetical protein CBF29_07725 [Vagococcus elongatus]|uniref:Uncharacterized protein n=1 Tax=Vagococcus elongatus TaxID=180344 RepID=A0A430AU29_9ENTE|nr:hypothetical protein CBF29_07725 [Vagococcus elongatus]